MFYHPTFFHVFLLPLVQVFPVEVWIFLLSPRVVTESAVVGPFRIAIAIVVG
jgi:hypothetical protein